MAPIRLNMGRPFVAVLRSKWGLRRADQALCGTVLPRPVCATRLPRSILSVSTRGQVFYRRYLFSFLILTLALISSGGFPARRCGAACAQGLPAARRTGEQDIYPLAPVCGWGTIDSGSASGGTYQTLIQSLNAVRVKGNDSDLAGARMDRGFERSWGWNRDKFFSFRSANLLRWALAHRFERIQNIALRRGHD